MLIALSYLQIFPNTQYNQYYTLSSPGCCWTIKFFLRYSDVMQKDIPAKFNP